MKHILTVAISTLCSMSVFAETPTVRIHRYGELRLAWNNEIALVYKESSPTGAVIYQQSNSYSPYGSQAERRDFGMSNYTALSVVGPLVSYAAKWYGEGGAHPSYGTLFAAFDMQTQKKANLKEYFSEPQILTALLTDSLLKPRVRNIQKVHTLTEFFKQADGGCELAIHDDILESFAFHHIKADRVAIRIGIPHGCEVNRGDFHQIGFYLPLPPKLKAALQIAEEQKTLMIHLAPNAFMK
ncbi:MAG: hypothetical protein JNM27_03405 [Leptospirales bacterium]|nr:hypothetical protein [Leptospirales bacterium]